MSLKRLADFLVTLLVLVLVGTYVAAKVHFFRRFGVVGLAGYIAEHWPYWAALGAIAALIAVVSRLVDNPGVIDGPGARGARRRTRA